MSERFLTIAPISFADACAFVDGNHRHHKAPAGHKFSISVVDTEGVVRGVACVGRPVAQALQDGFTLEVNRTATDGTPNANSMLYGAAWRAAKALGYRRLVTYTQEGETGCSLRAAGWRVVAELRPRKGWNGPARVRDDRNAGIARKRWEAPCSSA